MPLSLGIPLGVVIIVAGAILFLATRYKKTAAVVLGVGLAVTILTLVVIVLAANSPM